MFLSGKMQLPFFFGNFCIKTCMRFFFMSKLYFFMFVGLIESVAELDKLKY